MSAESLNRLSDVEIQRKLMEIGFPKTPVTETTRPILIKKLMKHARNEKFKKEKITNYVLYSNDKQNAHTPTVSIKKRPNLIENVMENNNEINVYRIPSVIYKGDERDNNVNANIHSNAVQQQQQQQQQNAASRMYAPPPVLASNYENENALNVSNNYRKMRSTLPCEPPANFCDGGVVNRLLSFRDTSIKKKFNYGYNGIQYAIPASKALKRNGIFKRLLMFDLKSFLRKPDISQSIIPHMLIASFVIFLAIISVLYTAKKYDLSPISQTHLRYTLCNPSDKDLQFSSHKISCISEDLFNKAIYISEELFKYLNERARLHHCVNDKHSPILQMSELEKALSTNIKGNLQEKLLATQYLIAENPQWMIKTTLSTELLTNSSDQILSFELIEPNLPLKCIILKKITRFFTVIGLLILVATACLIIYFTVAVYRVKQKESLMATEQFIKDILNELMYQSKHSENAEVIINQLQEKLLPPQKRSKLMNSWNKALKILQTNDNRVLFGMIARNGEQLRTMTWNKDLGNKEPGLPSKRWQSSAFDNSNKIVNPPTSCLKIRHMFDPSEIEQPNLKQLIVESIFEKVGTNCKICDVQLDTQTCCVYIRCASEADAGTIHNEINGWWFDKKLISIKFLRLERFVSRFPKSLGDPLYFNSANLN